MPSETVSRFRRHLGFRRAEAHPAILPPSGTDAKIMAGRNGRVGLSPPLQTASAHRFRRHPPSPSFPRKWESSPWGSGNI
ncbi:hypothetical protein [Neisseria polysaccharea]|uniref:hypothetical protein n=1 Tax=Neisseria polysaccharea TaxID=489 RepID=UPI0018C39959